MEEAPISAARRALLGALREPAAEAPDLAALVRAVGPPPVGPRAAELDGVVGELGRWSGLPPGQRKLVCARALRLLSAIAAEQAASAAEAPGSPRGRGGRQAPRTRRAPAPRRARDAVTLPSDPVDVLAGVGPRVAEALRARGLYTVADLAHLLPRTYDDRRTLSPIASLAAGARARVRGNVVQARWLPRSRFEALLQDETGQVRLVYFRAFPGQTQRLAVGRTLLVTGDVTEYRGALQMAHPDVEPDDAADAADAADGGAGSAAGRVVPVYLDVAGVPRRTLARAVAQAVQATIEGLPDGLPPAIAARRGLPSLAEALAALHAPADDLTDAALAELRAGGSVARRRLCFDEFFFLALGIHRRRQAMRRAVADPMREGTDALARLQAALSFPLTGAQRRVIDEIAQDLEKGEPMQRLLQGDVGSGKTLVALATILKVAASGGQTALMAPTEILAEQHHRVLAPLLSRFGFRAALLVGSQRSSARQQGRRSLELGSAQLALGTHALLSEGVAFQRLALAIVDEQHRFGVAQRLRLLEKGRAPHLLVMTATPIPRTLALTVYGDLDLSVLNEMPAGRLPIDTRLVAAKRLEEVLQFVERSLERGERGYFVCPLVSESSVLDLAAATDRHRLLTERFGAEQVVLLHGQMRAEDKDASMTAFLEGRARLLVSTTVVEVGIDVPEATFMIVDGAERFGLSQLHQLRGRVGRGTAASRCLLLSGARGDAWSRLERFVEAPDGFAVAELDLAVRGPGELFGLRQSGLPGFRFGDLLRDAELLVEARADAAELLATNPELEGPALEPVRVVLASRWAVTGAPVGEEAG